MLESSKDDTVNPDQGGGTTRRNVLIGAGSVAAATAVASMVGGGGVSAAQPSGLRCDMGPAIGSFPITSFQFGAGVGVGSPGGGGRTVSNPSVSEITISKSSDGSSAKLLASLTQGTVTPTVTITSNVKGQIPSTYVLTDVIVSGYSQSSGGESITDSISLNFTKVAFTAGTTVTYDLATNTTTTS